MTVLKKIGVIVGSTRSNRLGLNVAQWYINTSGLNKEFDVTVIDLAEENLPLYDEALPPMALKGNYTFDHAKKWQQKIAALDSFVFVTPEYNRGYPASLKNAIDYLWKEWCDKPTTIVSYGFAGGQYAAAQLAQIISGNSGIQTKLIETRPQITLNGQMYDTNGKIDMDKSFEPFAEQAKKSVQELVALFNTADSKQE